MSLTNAERRALYITQRGDKCEVCGFTGPAEAFDFHHVEPSNKEQRLKQNLWTAKRGTPLGSTWLEANKCALLCANCHRLEHVALKEGRSILPENYHTPDGSTSTTVTQE